MEKIILYTTHCPRCNVLTKKLDNVGIDYEVCDDVEIMKERGFMQAPMLDVKGEVMDFSQAVKWINGES